VGDAIKERFQVGGSQKYIQNFFRGFMKSQLRELPNKVSFFAKTDGNFVVIRPEIFHQWRFASRRT
jgi:hypothetical protein